MRSSWQFDLAGSQYLLTEWLMEPTFPPRVQSFSAHHRLFPLMAHMQLSFFDITPPPRASVELMGKGRKLCWALNDLLPESYLQEMKAIYTCLFHQSEEPFPLYKEARFTDFVSGVLGCLYCGMHFWGPHMVPHPLLPSFQGIQTMAAHWAGRMKW